MRILFYTDDPGIGGAAACTHRLALGFARRGFDVVYAVTRRTDNRAAEQAAAREAAGIRHAFLPFDTLKHYYFGTQDRMMTGALLLEHRPDLIIFSDGVLDSALGARRAAAGLGIPFIGLKHMVVDNNPWTQHPSIRRTMAEILPLERCSVTVSQPSRDLLIKLFGAVAERTIIIPNSCPDAYFQPRDMAARARLRAEWGLGEDDVAVLTPARIYWLKGHELMVEAMRRLRQRGGIGRLKMVWIGDADEKFLPGLEQSIAAHGLEGDILRLGPRTDVTDCLDAADVFLLPSFSEGMPLSLLEAMAKGVPAIATAVGGIPEALDGLGRLLPDPKDGREATAAALVEALADWRDDPAERARLAAAAQIRARAEFHEDVQVDRFIALAQRCALPPGDYVSPGLKLVMPDRAFPFMSANDAERLPFTPSRPGVTHTQYVDARATGMGFLSRDEAVLLHNLALPFRGRRALEIGGWFGWTSWHLLAAGVELDVLEPYLEDSTLQRSFLDALRPFLDRVRPHVGLSPQAVRALGRRDGGWRWSLFVIDVDPDGPHILESVRVCMEHATDDAMIVLHDVWSPDAAPALALLRAAGWSIRIYDTALMLAAAWRGDAAPAVDHIPDPAVAWTRPDFLAAYVSPP